MTDHSVTHATVVLEHAYAASPAQVFDAWADPAVKTRWFTGALNPAAAPMSMDFRVGGTERTMSSADDAVIVYARLSLAEWVVLCLVCEAPSHGFALVRMLADDGELGQVLRVPKPANVPCCG